MRRLKTVSAILSALVLIAGLALLPQGIAGISDLLTNGKPEMASIHTVELALTSDQTDEPGYMMRKLALEQRMTTIPIKPEQAKMTEEEVLDAARDGMKVYMEAKMFDWFEYDFCSAEAYLGIDPEDKNNNTIFWGVSFEIQDKTYHQLFLHIDDETGKILFISYETYGEDLYNYYYPDNQRRMIEGFVDSFFGSLNLTNRNEYENLLAESVSEQEETDDMTRVRYTFVDARYGSINIEFYICPFGFYVAFPSEWGGDPYA